MDIQRTPLGNTPLIENLSIKQREQIASYNKWKISKSSLGRNKNLLGYYLSLNENKDIKKVN